MRATILATLLVFSPMLASTQVQAQGNPSQDEIIQSLRPGARVPGGTRGIHLGAPPAAAPDLPAPDLPAPDLPATEPAPAAAAPSHVWPQTAARPGGAIARHSSHPAPSVASGPAPSINLNVRFRTNSAELTPAAIHTLDELGRALSSSTLASYHFRIEGHTDTVGSHEANRALSERRAASVVDYLSSRFGVDRARLEAVGMGEDNLLIPTPPQVPETRNRRVLVVNTGA